MPSILVTDDDATTRLMVRGLLEKAGYSVATASDGVKALEALQKDRFDLVLLDIGMPKMNGLGLLGRLLGCGHRQGQAQRAFDQSRSACYRSHLSKHELGRINGPL